MSHKKSIIPIKFAEIDLAISPIIEWLNTFNDVNTLYSCEGNKDSSAIVDQPYITFFCRYQEVLLHIMTFLNMGTSFEVHNDPGTTTLLYTVRFESYACMLEYVEFIEEINIED
jgi:hypothetical protein